MSKPYRIKEGTEPQRDMTDVEIILFLIEQVDPADADALDEIDVRVWCYINSEVFHEGTEYNCGFDNPYGVGNDVRRYSRSRDALKAIRPEGWLINGIWQDQDGWFCVGISKTKERFQSPDTMPTEELAELHAIVQAIGLERQTNDP